MESRETKHSKSDGNNNNNVIGTNLRSTSAKVTEVTLFVDNVLLGMINEIQDRIFKAIKDRRKQNSDEALDNYLSICTSVGEELKNNLQQGYKLSQQEIIEVYVSLNQINQMKSDLLAYTSLVDSMKQAYESKKVLIKKTIKPASLAHLTVQFFKHPKQTSHFISDLHESIFREKKGLKKDILSKLNELPRLQDEAHKLYESITRPAIEEPESQRSFRW